MNQFQQFQQHHPPHFMGHPPPPQAQSPPIHQQPPPMPPRPRPEGGQESSPPFLDGGVDFRGHRKPNQDLVIDSWSNDDADKKPPQQFSMDMRKPEDKFGGPGGVSGWGGPPPANPSGWGNAKAPSVGGSNNWQQPPPNQMQPPQFSRGGCDTSQR